MENKPNTKKLLLTTTEKLVTEYGCTKMTLNHIMKETSLSKGAIYHYVKSKDELLALVLKERVEETSGRFFTKVNEGRQGLDGPLSEIIKNVPHLEDANDPANKIFIYLLSKTGQPEIRSLLNNIYTTATQASTDWIATGQDAGVIPKSVDKWQAAEFFTLLSYGLRVRSMISDDPSHFDAEDFKKFISNSLK
jgi:AcrR family transcriptional regulator